MIIEIEESELKHKLYIEFLAGYDQGFTEGSKWGLEKVIELTANKLPKPMILKKTEDL